MRSFWEGLLLALAISFWLWVILSLAYVLLFAMLAAA